MGQQHHFKHIQNVRAHVRCRKEKKTLGRNGKKNNISFFGRSSKARGVPRVLKMKCQQEKTRKQLAE